MTAEQTGMFLLQSAVSSIDRLNAERTSDPGRGHRGNSSLQT